MRIEGRNWLALWWLWIGVLFSFTYLLAPIWAADFFWHLKTGQWIVEHHALPTVDPFSFATGAATDVRQGFILTSYWLSQSFYYLIFEYSGWFGFFVLRFVLIAGLISFLLLRKHDDSLIYSILISFFCVVIFLEYAIDRPNFMSIVFFSAFLFFIERLKNTNYAFSRYSIYLLLSIIVWSNVHGGIIVGQIVCIGYMADSIVQYFLKNIDSVCLKRSTTLFSVAIFCSFLNPNMFNYLDIVEIIFSNKYYFYNSMVKEYVSIAECINNGKFFYIFFIVIFILALYFHIKKGIKKNIVDIIFLLSFFYFSFLQVRYLPFFAILSLPSAANTLCLFKKKCILPSLLVLFFCLILDSRSLAHAKNLKDLSTYGYISNRYPQDAVDFVKNNNIKGRILNSYEWGGFLIWSLGDNSQVFVDGRGLDMDSFKDYINLVYILSKHDKNETNFQSLEKNYRFEYLLNKYDFDYILLPRTKDGEIFNLTQEVARSNKWKIVFKSGNAVVFVKNLSY